MNNFLPFLGKSEQLDVSIKSYTNFSPFTSLSQPRVAFEK